MESSEYGALSIYCLSVACILFFLQIFRASRDWSPDIPERECGIPDDVLLCPPLLHLLDHHLLHCQDKTNTLRESTKLLSTAHSSCTFTSTYFKGDPAQHHTPRPLLRGLLHADDCRDLAPLQTDRGHPVSVHLQGAHSCLLHGVCCRRSALV